MRTQQLNVPVKPGVSIPTVGTRVVIAKDENYHGEGALHISKVGMTGKVWGYSYRRDAEYLHWYNVTIIVDLDSKAFFTSHSCFLHDLKEIPDEQ